MTRASRLTLVATLLALLAASACGDNAATTTPSSVSSPTTVNWTGLLGSRGAASRTFTASQSGSVSITLDTSPVPLGLGIGVPASSTSGCRPSSTMVAVAGAAAALTTRVEQGSYCVMVFDSGSIPDQIAFAVTFVYP